MSLTQLTERARVPLAQVFRAVQGFLDPLVPRRVVGRVGRPCRHALRARQAVDTGTAVHVVTYRYSRLPAGSRSRGHE